MDRGYKVYDFLPLLNDYDIKEFKRDDSIIDIISTLTEKMKIDDPFFVVDLSTVIDQMNRWKENLGRISPYYAIKCNPDNAIIKLLSMMDIGFDCASMNEISRVLSFDISPGKIIFANPSKDVNHLKYARREDVDLLTFDCEEELYKIKNYHPNADLIIRIKVDDSNSQCKFSSKFGADLIETMDILKIAKSMKLNIVGVSFHVGSNCESVETYDKAIRDARKVFDKAKEIGIEMTILDIGGGFPGQRGGKIEFEEIAKQVNSSLDNYFNDLDIKIIAEPGRYFVSESHTLVLNVISKKTKIDRDSGEKSFLYTLNDGIYGSFNCIIFDHSHPEILPFNERDGEKYRCTIFGPTCDSVDTISRDCLLPDLAIGEIVYVHNFGAYTKAAASSFNGFSQTSCVYIMRI